MKNLRPLVLTALLFSVVSISCASDAIHAITPAQARIDGSLLLTLDQITAETAANLIPNKDSTVVVYCRTGRRSSLSVKILKEMGYSKAFDLGGLNSWPYSTINGPRASR